MLFIIDHSGEFNFTAPPFAGVQFPETGLASYQESAEGYRMEFGIFELKQQAESKTQHLMRQWAL